MHSHLRELRRNPKLGIYIGGISILEETSMRASLLALFDKVAQHVAPMPLDDDDEDGRGLPAGKTLTGNVTAMLCRQYGWTFVDAGEDLPPAA